MEKKSTEQEVQTWQEHVADDVLAIAVAITVQGGNNHKVKIGIDAAVQAAGMAYCSERAREHWGEERKRQENMAARIADSEDAGPILRETTPGSQRPVQE